MCAWSPPRRLAARPRAGRGRADPVARAAEGADPSGALTRPRASACATRRPRSAATKLSPRRARAEPAHNEPQDIPLTIVFEDEHLLVSTSRRAGRPSGRRQFRRDPGQRAAPPLRRRCRGSAASPGRASSTASTRTRRGCWWSPRPTSPTKGWRSSSPRTDRPALSGDRLGRAEDQRRTIDAPLARSAPTARRSRSSKEGPRQARGDPLEAAESSRTRRWSNAGSKPAGPTRSGSTWPRSAIRCSATRSTAAGKTHRQVLKELGFHRQALHAAELGFIHPVTKSRLVVRSAIRRTCRNCSARLVYRI
jgi:23S rRNA pseudouridine1911/1915/1917 synthase